MCPVVMDLSYLPFLGLSFLLGIRKSSDSWVSKLSLEKKVFKYSKSTTLSSLDLLLFVMILLSVGKRTPLQSLYQVSEVMR